LKDLLEYLSVCFDSLAKAFPQLEAVKELVDAVKWYLSPSEKWVEVK
jgi:hypothetical protein